MFSLFCLCKQSYHTHARAHTHRVFRYCFHSGCTLGIYMYSSLHQKSLILAPKRPDFELFKYKNSCSSRMRNGPNIAEFGGGKRYQVRKAFPYIPPSAKTHRNRLGQCPGFFIIFNVLLYLFLNQKKLLVSELLWRLFSA